MTLPHYTAHTPMFMPVGTQGTHARSAAAAPQRSRRRALALVTRVAPALTLRRFATQAP
jgi:queuine/archaeosine tRNA-ribosyltransferase